MALRSWLSRKDTAVQDRRRRECASCAGRDLWPSGLEASGAPLVCRACGAILDDAYRPLELDSESGTFFAPGEKDLVAGVAPSLGLDELDAKVVAIARTQHGAAPRDLLSGYVRAVCREVGVPTRASLTLLDAGEPLLTGLPAGSLVLSLGLLASLEDEAQLAFVLAREAWLLEHGWFEKRFTQAAARASSNWLARVLPGRPDALAEALSWTLKVGWGRELERSADAEALRRVARLGYDPRSAARAPLLVERACLHGRGARFVLDRERTDRLEAATRQPCPAGRINREVYRRAVGGFAVFSAPVN